VQVRISAAIMNSVTTAPSWNIFKMSCAHSKTLFGILSGSVFYPFYTVPSSFFVFGKQANATDFVGFDLVIVQ
jgi:hypothetical protein